MVAFVSSGLGLGHKDFDGYKGKLRSTRGSVVATGFGRGRRIWLLWLRRP